MRRTATLRLFSSGNREKRRKPTLFPPVVLQEHPLVTVVYELILTNRKNR